MAGIGSSQRKTSEASSLPNTKRTEQASFAQDRFGSAARARAEIAAKECAGKLGPGWLLAGPCSVFFFHLCCPARSPTDSQLGASFSRPFGKFRRRWVHILGPDEGPKSLGFFEIARASACCVTLARRGALPVVFLHWPLGAVLCIWHSCFVFPWPKATACILS